ncbi:SIMPL domain-containing protein [Emticicia agri]|uniref:SIMPL domain-containing protein n=1 Tax=Emticicia agri TaxID=2492393 RepID=UPI0013EDE1C3|nr:SIMPL domain-containing protein [Emticicia agri]
MTKKVILLLLLPFWTFGQSYYPDNRIIVVGEASIDIPADNVVFNIQLKFTDSTDIKVAYSKHKNAENLLVNFLKENGVPNKNITYTPISVGKAMVYNTGKRDIEFGTLQSVSVRLEDVKKYAEFMMKLISAGFTDVNVSFTSSKENDFQDVLIQKAIEVAGKKAEAMAKASKRAIKKILKVSDTGETDSTFIYRDANNFNDMSDMASENNITEIPRTINKRYRVKVVFALK